MPAAAAGPAGIPPDHDQTPLRHPQVAAGEDLARAQEAGAAQDEAQYEDGRTGKSGACGGRSQHTSEQALLCMRHALGISCTTMDATSTPGPVGRRRAAGRISAGLLMYRQKDGRGARGIHRPRRTVLRPPGRGVWTIPRTRRTYLLAPPSASSRRDGLPPAGPTSRSGRQANRKTVHAWAFAGDWDPERPLRQHLRARMAAGLGTDQDLPEADRGEFVNGATAVLADPRSARSSGGSAPGSQARS
jgi:predicted NUDIX family NTP pyrophosphohydrolase